MSIWINPFLKLIPTTAAKIFLLLPHPHLFVVAYFVFIVLFKVLRGWVSHQGLNSDLPHFSARPLKHIGGALLWAMESEGTLDIV